MRKHIGAEAGPALPHALPIRYRPCRQPPAIFTSVVSHKSGAETYSSPMVPLSRTISRTGMHPGFQPFRFCLIRVLSSRESAGCMRVPMPRRFRSDGATTTGRWVQTPGADHNGSFQIKSLRRRQFSRHTPPRADHAPSRLDGQRLKFNRKHEPSPEKSPSMDGRGRRPGRCARCAPRSVFVPVNRFCRNDPEAFCISDPEYDPSFPAWCAGSGGRFPAAQPRRRRAR